MSQEKQDSIENIEFSPIQVRLYIGRFGGETYAGIVDRKIYDYFKENKYDIAEYSYDGEEMNIPEEFQPFPPGCPYECDTLWHSSGPFLESNFILYNDETNEIIWECDEIEKFGVKIIKEDDSIDSLNNLNLDEGTVIFSGGEVQKGDFFEAKFTLTYPFDPKKLTVYYESYITGDFIYVVEYDGEELNGEDGYSTSGYEDIHKWIIIGDEEVYEAIPMDERDEDE